MTPDELQDRTKQFALRILKLADSLENGKLSTRTIARQIVRSGTSVSANYRSSRRARSHKEFTARIGIVVEEADETLFWLELLIEGGYSRTDRLSLLVAETTELVRIFSRMKRTARMRKSKGKKTE